MGNFRKENYEESAVGYSQKEACKPDYEGMIKKQREAKDLLSSLQGAAMDVCFSEMPTLSVNKLKDLIGDTYVAILEINEKISYIMKEQAKSD